VHQQVPSKGEIKVFNRSHYEDVLIQKVHQWVNIEVIEQRYKQINNFETLLEENGTKIIKCYLHVSPEKQLERLIDRKENPEEHYKHNENDWIEREYWNAYQDAYHQAFLNCNQIPWHIIPADKGWYKSLLVSKLLLNSLKNV
jgi:polyphosphate kinase 2 (PPK2 family)